MTKNTLNLTADLNTAETTITEMHPKVRCCDFFGETCRGIRFWITNAAGDAQCLTDDEVASFAKDFSLARKGRIVGGAPVVWKAFLALLDSKDSKEAKTITNRLTGLYEKAEAWELTDTLVFSVRSQGSSPKMALLRF